MSSSPNPDSPVMPLGQDGQGRSVLLMPYDEGLASEAVGKALNEQTDSDPEAKTPDPTSEEENYDSRKGGPVRRFNDIFTSLGSVQIEALGLDGYEIAQATTVFRDETFLNNFPILIPRFTVKCEDDDCGAEYDEEIAFCLECARREMLRDGVSSPPADPADVPEGYRDHPVRHPDPAQKREAEREFESVNKEGQSLRDLYKLCEDDHNRLGVGLHVVKWRYVIAQGDVPTYDPGDMIHEEIDELVRGDPKRIVPVVDANGRVGNYWWACPVHRPPHEAAVVEREPGHCEVCNSRLREVYFVEKESGAATVRKPTKYYFNEEIVTWAFWYPRLNGLDGLSPTHHVWLKQAILHWMDVYASAFYDPSSDRYPNKFMVVHTTNPDTWERNFKKAESDAKENPYSEQIMMNEYSGESQSTPEVQVIDLMNDELLGQDDQMKKRFKSDIRQNWRVTDVFDSELEDAGGLNNEGLQLEVTERGVASRHHDLSTGPLDELAKLMGLTDYRMAFVPEQDEDTDERQAKIDLGQAAADAGLDARLEDGEVDIADGDFEESADAEAGGGGFFSEDADGEVPDADDPEAGGDPEATLGNFSSRELERLTEKLDEGFEHIVWADEDTKADPFWDADDQVPEFVQDAIEAVIDRGDAIFDGIQSLTSGQERKLEDFFREKLTQPEGWSLGSIAEDLQDRFDLDQEVADTIGRTESARVLNKTREEAYKQQGDVDGRKFKWTGPSDHRETDACAWVKEQTKGGVSLERMHDILEEASAKFFPNLKYGGDLVLHPNERHTMIETFKAEFGEAPGPAAVQGTFQEVSA
ncbi:hypothetical protein [Natronosalvus rutilus]|uniref:Uncharacterized protein n=1 Tax=Natronosalvus rutilus TaxID=2953753 RepID=A0A9E7NCZ1_9EURY|nr:hypothetical protein [Natronosalvus rutilus]UTF55997.1 hypothetical protein NGM29_20635 [Natronosalvus rutilus]